MRRALFNALLSLPSCCVYFLRPTWRNRRRASLRRRLVRKEALAHRTSAAAAAAAAGTEIGCSALQAGTLTRHGPFGISVYLWWHLHFFFREINPPGLIKNDQERTSPPTPREHSSRDRRRYDPRRCSLQSREEETKSPGVVRRLVSTVWLTVVRKCCTIVAYRYRARLNECHLQYQRDRPAAGCRAHAGQLCFNSPGICAKLLIQHSVVYLWGLQRPNTLRTVIQDLLHYF